MKVVFAARGLPVPDYLVVGRKDWLAEPKGVAARILESLRAAGLRQAREPRVQRGHLEGEGPRELDAALSLAAEFDRKIVIEAAVPHAREIECAVLGNDAPEASVPGEIIPSREFYDYEAKYLDDGSEIVIPAVLDGDQAAAVKTMAIEAFLAVDAAGMARVDFLLNRETGAIFVNEINTIPGFTTISMYAKLWEASGVPYATLLDRLIALALERHSEKQALRTSAL